MATMRGFFFLNQGLRLIMCAVMGLGGFFVGFIVVISANYFVELDTFLFGLIDKIHRNLFAITTKQLAFLDFHAGNRTLQRVVIIDIMQSNHLALINRVFALHLEQGMQKELEENNSVPETIVSLAGKVVDGVNDALGMFAEHFVEELPICIGEVVQFFNVSCVGLFLCHNCKNYFVLINFFPTLRFGRSLRVRVGGGELRRT